MRYGDIDLSYTCSGDGLVPDGTKLLSAPRRGDQALLRNSVIILCMHPASERRRYNVTLCLIGWANAQNDLWLLLCNLIAVYVKHNQTLSAQINIATTPELSEKQTTSCMTTNTLIIKGFTK